jgi:hypothetical protein
MLVNDNNQEIKFWVKTTQGLFGPYGSKEQAVSSSLILPRALNEAPEILQRTVDGKEILFG